MSVCEDVVGHDGRKELVAVFGWVVGMENVGHAADEHPLTLAWYAMRVHLF